MDVKEIKLVVNEIKLVVNEIELVECGKNKYVFFVLNVICSLWFMFEYVICFIVLFNKI